MWAGQPDLAIKHFETSLRLNPREHRANPFMGIGVGGLRKIKDDMAARKRSAETIVAEAHAAEVALDQVLDGNG